MRCKLSSTAFRDWLEGYLRVNYPNERFYVLGRHGGDGLDFTFMGGVMDIPMTFVTPDIVDVEVKVIPSQRDDFPHEQAEQHVKALRAAIRKQWGLSGSMNAERDAEIYMRHERYGTPYRELAAEFGIGYERIKQIVRTERRKR